MAPACFLINMSSIHNVQCWAVVSYRDNSIGKRNVGVNGKHWYLIVCAYMHTIVDEYLHCNNKIYVLHTIPLPKCILHNEKKQVSNADSQVFSKCQ